MEDAIKNWCDSNITVGMCYRGSMSINDPIAVVSIDIQDRNEIISKRSGKLIYQDGTACSASYAFADVYKLDSDSYQVYMDCGCAKFTGDNPENEYGIETKTFSKLSEVVDYLASFSGHDANSCGELIDYLINRINNEHIIIHKSQPWFRHKTSPILYECDNNYELIQMIKDYGSHPYNKINDR